MSTACERCGQLSCTGPAWCASREAGYHDGCDSCDSLARRLADSEREREDWRLAQERLSGMLADLRAAWKTTQAGNHAPDCAFLTIVPPEYGPGCDCDQPAKVAAAYKLLDGETP